MAVSSTARALPGTAGSYSVCEDEERDGLLGIWFQSFVSVNTPPGRAFTHRFFKKCLFAVC